MDAAAVQLLRELLAGDPLMGRTEEFADSLNRSVSTPGGLLLVGTPTEEPWHLAAHLDDESRFADLPELSPTLVRWQPPAGAPAHLSIGLERIEHASRGETLFVVAPDAAPDELLERVADAKRIGATILTMGTDEDELTGLAHDALIVPTPFDPNATTLGVMSPSADGQASTGVDAHAAILGLSFDAAQHLVSMTAGQMSRGRGRRDVRSRLARLIDGITGPPTKW